MSKNYEKVNNYYIAYLNGESWGWSIDRVWNVTGKSTGITEEEYNEITGCIYPSKVQEEINE